MSTVYAHNDRAFYCNNYGKYNPGGGGESIEARIRLERIDHPANNGTFMLRMFRDPNIGVRLFIQDFIWDGMDTSVHESNYYYNYVTIFICYDPANNQVFFIDTAPSDPIKIMAVYLPNHHGIIDRDNVFLTTIPKVNITNQRFNISLFGVVPLRPGEADYDMGPAINQAFKIAEAIGLPILEFPSGTYTIAYAFVFSASLIYRGIGKVIIRPMKDAYGNYVNISPLQENFLTGAIENITFEHCYIASYSIPSSVRNVRYENIAIDYPEKYDFSAVTIFNVNSDPSYHVFKNIKVHLGAINCCIYGQNNSNVIIENCEFYGHFVKTIILENCSNAIIRSNVIHDIEGGTGYNTGIQCVNFQPTLCHNILIENNTISGCTDAGIWFDSYPQLLLGQGYIQEVYNDTDDYLCLVLSTVNSPTEPNVDILQINPKDCVFVFANETGIDGQYYFIEDITLQNSKKIVRLQTRRPSSGINTGSNTVVTFTSGFLDCNINNNTLYGNDNLIHWKHGVAIRIGINPMGFNIIGNHVYGGQNGIRYQATVPQNISFFYMALNGKISANSFFGLKRTVLDMGDELAAYNYSYMVYYYNHVSGNTFVNCDQIFIRKNEKMMFFNNVIENTNLHLEEIDDSFITNNFFTGGAVTKTSLGSGCVITNNVGII